MDCRDFGRVGFDPIKRDAVARKSISVQPNSHLLGFNNKPLFANRWKSVRRCVQCSSADELAIRMSSR